MSAHAGGLKLAFVFVAAAVALAVAALGCTGGRAVHSYEATTGGDPERGKVVITERHCGACHAIPGIVGANGVIGPPLAGIPNRSYIGGVLPNSPTNLVRWIEDPQHVDPKTAMPTLGLDEIQARDAAAYLYTLR